MRAIFVGLLLTASAFAQDVVLPDGKAKALVQDACGDCHGLDRVVSSGMSADKWKTTVTRMVKKGAALSPEQIDDVVEYLSVYFAAEKININHATAQDLQIDMQFTPRRGGGNCGVPEGERRFQGLRGASESAGSRSEKAGSEKRPILVLATRHAAA